MTYDSNTKLLASEITTVGDLKRVLAPFTDEAQLLHSVSITYHRDLERGSQLRIRED